MEVNNYYSEEELSSIRFSCADEAIGEVKNLFFQDQLEEERILLEIYSPNTSDFALVDLNRLKIDRIFSRKHIANRSFLRHSKLVDSNRYQLHFDVDTILEIKNEQRRLGIEFKAFYVLLPKSRLAKLKGEPHLFAAVGADVYYLLNKGEMLDQRKKHFSLSTLKNWIQKKIFTKTSTRS